MLESTFIYNILLFYMFANFTMLISYIHCSILIGITVEGLLPAILKSKVRSGINSSYTDSKLWMKFLEKRLEMVNNPLKKENQVTSFLDFLKKYYAQNLFRGISTDCEKKSLESFPGLQVVIFGHICASSKGVETKIKQKYDHCYDIYDKFPALLRLVKEICYRHIMVCV